MIEPVTDLITKIVVAVFSENKKRKVLEKPKITAGGKIAHAGNATTFPLVKLELAVSRQNMKLLEMVIFH